MLIRLIVPMTYWNADHAEKEGLDPISCYGLAIADIAGGFTATQATGGWKDSSGNLVVEPVTVFDCAIADKGVLYNEGKVNCFRALAQRIARELHQEVVYLQIDATVEFISA